jgi:hypothetical protein
VALLSGGMMEDWTSRPARAGSAREFALCAWLLAFFAMFPPAHAQTELEEKVKAAFLLNFARYVEWPAGTFADEKSPVVIGVLAEDPESFSKNLERVVEGKTVDNRPVQVQRAQRVSELAKAHVVFIPASERERMRGAIGQLRGRPVLTVSDAEGFIQGGGMILLKRKQENNRAAAEEAGLKISSKLLRLGDETR